MYLDIVAPLSAGADHVSTMSLPLTEPLKSAMASGTSHVVPITDVYAVPVPRLLIALIL